MDSGVLIVGIGFIAFGAWVGTLSAIAPKIRREITQRLIEHRRGQSEDYEEPPPPLPTQREHEPYRSWQNGQQGAVYLAREGRQWEQSSRHL